MQVSFSIPGRVGGKGRPRSAIRRKKTGQQFVQVYTDSKTLTGEALVRSLAAEAMDGRPPIEGPLVLEVAVTLNTPPSWSKKRRAAAIYVVGRPDCTNVLKLVEDAINGIVWKDDSQICDATIKRRYNDSVGESVQVKIYPPTEQPSVPRSTSVGASPLFAGLAA